MTPADGLEARRIHSDLLDLLDGEDLAPSLLAAMALVASVGVQLDGAADWDEVHEELDAMIERAERLWASVRDDAMAEDGLVYMSLPHGVGEA